MLYTPGQFMTALGLSKQQWRTFRKALGCLNSDSGHAPSFTAGQLLATRVAQYVGENLHASLTVVAPLSAQLFRICESAPWPQLERSKIALYVAQGAVELLPLEQIPRRGPIVVIVELWPLISGLREKLLEAAADDQPSLAFPPMIAGGRQ